MHNMEPSMPPVTPTGMSAPSPGLPNTMSSPSNKPASPPPVGAAPAASPVPANPSVGGTMDQSITPTMGGEMKAAALKRAEILSALYCLSKAADEDEVNVRQHSQFGGAAGLMGGLAGSSYGAVQEAKKNPPPLVAKPNLQGLSPLDQLKTKAKSLEAEEVAKKLVPGSFKHIREIIRVHGVKKVLPKILAAGLLGAGAGAAIGAGIGYARKKYSEREK